METESQDLLEHVLLPVATPDDARVTARAFAPYEHEQVTVMHVVEKGGGVPDKTPVEQSEELAEEAYAVVQEILPEADTHTVYGRDVADAIFETATELEVSAIAYRSRGGGRLMHVLSGNLSLKLVTEGPVPVIALPQPGDAEE